MTAFQVIITEPAEQDLHMVINYISKELHNPLAAKKLLRNIKLKVELLKTYPKRFPLVRDKVLALKNIRKIPIDQDRKSTRLNSSHVSISYAVFCLKKTSKNRAQTICRETIRKP